jgi:hypothetical protein
VDRRGTANRGRERRNYYKQPYTFTETHIGGLRKKFDEAIYKIRSPDLMQEMMLEVEVFGSDFPPEEAQESSSVVRT